MARAMKKAHNLHAPIHRFLDALWGIPDVDFDNLLIVDKFPFHHHVLEKGLRRILRIPGKTQKLLGAPGVHINVHPGGDGRSERAILPLVTIRTFAPRSWA